MLHSERTATDEPQLLVCEKSPAVVILEIAKAADPGFERVIVCAALEVEICCAPKFNDPVDRDAWLTPGVAPRPLNAIALSELGAVRARLNTHVLSPVEVGWKGRIMV